MLAVVLQPLSAETSVGPNIIDDLLQPALNGDTTAADSLAARALQLNSTQANTVLDKIRTTGNKRLCNIVARFASHPDDWIRHKAVTIISILGVDSSATVEVLLEKMNDTSPMVCQAANEALVSIHDARTWFKLITMLNEKNEEKKNSAHGILKKICNADMPPDNYVWQSWYLKKLDDEKNLFDDFRAGLNSTDSSEVIKAIEGLSSLELLRDQAVKTLAAVSKSQSPEIRARIDDRLWQWTGSTDGNVATIAFVHFPSFYPDNYRIDETLPPSISTGEQAPTEEKAFLDTPTGLITLAAGICGLIALLFWLFGTPAGQTLRITTRHYAHKAGTKVFVMVDKSEAPITKKVSAAKSKPAATSRVPDDLEVVTAIGGESLADVAAKLPSASSGRLPALEKKKPIAGS